MFTDRHTERIGVCISSKFVSPNRSTAGPCIALVAALSSILLLLTGCVIPRHFEAKPLSVEQDTSKIPLSVDLVLPEEFCNYKFEQWRGGDWRIFYLGAALCEYAEDAASRVFSSISISHGDKDQPAGEVDATLTPRVINVELMFPPTIFQENEVIIIVGWSLVGRKGRTIWAAEVQGNVRNKKLKRVFDDAMREVFEQSVRDMISARTIREYAQKD